jgi:GT2 family glycosyltransferase
MQTLFILSAFVAVLTIGLFLLFEIAVARVGTVQPLAEGKLENVQTNVTVVIPARNEEADIEEALRSILSQKGVALQVIVVNDHSTDRTGTILKRLVDEDSRITLVENPPLAAGWLGKPNAMNHGLALASNELILFTDADVIHHSTSFATGITLLQKRGLDFLSLLPRIDCVSFWENVCIPLPLFPFTVQCTWGANDPKSPNAWAAGAFMLIKANVLREIGGIGAVRKAIVDDAELAKVVKRSGHRVGYHLAPNMEHVRLFKGNSHAFWGPTKNAIALTFDRPWMALPAIALPFLFFWLPIATAFVGLSMSDIPMIVVGLLQPIAGLLGLIRIRPHCDFRWNKAVFFPLIAIPIACVLGKAFYEQHIRRQHVWRDRVIDLSNSQHQ